MLTALVGVTLKHWISLPTIHKAVIKMSILAFLNIHCWRNYDVIKGSSSFLKPMKTELLGCQFTIFMLMWKGSLRFLEAKYIILGIQWTISNLMWIRINVFCLDNSQFYFYKYLIFFGKYIHKRSLKYCTEIQRLELTNNKTFRQYRL